MNTFDIRTEISARHVHLSQKDIDRLFGKDYSLTFHKELIGAFLAKERITLIGKKHQIENVAILGPARDETQIELSFTDARFLGIPAPVRLSGNLKNTPGIKISLKDGTLIELGHGCIIPQRHMHLTENFASTYKLKQNQQVKLKIDTGIGRNLTFEQVIVRIGGTANVVHLDTDEGNAAGIDRKTKGICIIE